MGDDKPKGQTTAFKSFLAGGCGGMSLVFVGHPLDTIKVLLQTAPAGKYTGLVDCAKQTVASHGIRGGLYKGMAAPLAGVTPIFAIYFMGYNWGKQIASAIKGPFVDKDGNINTAGIMFAGGFSALPGTALMVPGDRIKVMLQSQAHGTGPKLDGPIEAGKYIIQHEGVRGLYKGTGLTLLRDGPGSVAYYGGYEVLKRMLTPKESQGELSVAAVLTAGGLAGVCNWLVAVPPDTVKSRFQTAPASKYPGGVSQVVKEIMSEGGVMSLYRGLGPALIRAFPANAACFFGYELSLKAMNLLW